MSGAPPPVAPRAEAWLLVAVPALATLFDRGAPLVGLALWHGVVALLVIGALLRPGGRAPDRGVPAGPLAAWAAFLTLVALGATRAPYAFGAWLNAVELAAVTAVLVLAARHGRALLRIGIWPLGFVAAAQALVAVAQWMGGRPRPAGTLLNPNHLGGFLVAVLLLLAGEALATADRRRRIAAVGLAVPLLPALIVSGSRGALLGGLVGAAWLSRVAWARLTPRSRWALFGVAVVVAAPAVLRVAERLQDTDPFLFHRAKIWRAALGPVADDPLWGSGPGQFALAVQGYQFDDGHGALRFDKVFRVPHSDLVRVPAEFGIPAAIVAAVGLLAFVAAARRRGGTGTEDASGAAAALLAIGTQALVDNPSRWPALYLLAAVLAGLLVSRRVVAPADRPPASLRAALAAVVALVFVVGDVGPTVAHLKAARLPQGRLDAGELRALDLVTLINPLQPEFARRHADHLLASGAAESLARYAAAREAAERAIRLSPRDSRYHWGLARLEGQACLELFGTADSRDRTYEALERAQQLSPTDARIRLDAADFALAVGDTAYARRLTERALALEPRAVTAHVMAARVLLEAEPAAAGRAAEHLARAEALASEHAAAARESPYGRELMTLDAARLAALRSRLAVAAAGE